MDSEGFGFSMRKVGGIGVLRIRPLLSRATWRKRERERDIYIYIHMFTCIYIYIYIYRDPGIYMWK